MQDGDSRIFTGGQDSPEVIAANKAYFEGQGAVVEIEGDAPAPAAEPAKPVEQPPAAEPVKVSEPTDDQVDAEIAADLEKADKDGPRKLSRVKKLHIKIAEESAARAKEEARRIELEAEVATLRKSAAPTPVATQQPAKAAVTKVEFPDPEPKVPTVEDFPDAADPYGEVAKALPKYVRESIAYEKRKDAFEVAEAARRNTQETEEQEFKRETEERQARINRELEEVKAEDPTFDVQKIRLNPAMNAALSNLPGGVKLFKRLSEDPTRFQELSEATKASKTYNGVVVPTQSAYDTAVFLLGQYAKEQPAPAAAKPAAAAPPSAAPAPREVQAEPAPAKGRGTGPTVRIDDMPDTTARRDARKLQMVG